ncbi:MAG: hypothetical protein HY278_11405 [candidate division NC10 bacterium]|nr:hypothetical protein [candidate division NC10 bacterium]
MVATYRLGISIRKVARTFGVDPSTVLFWTRRAEGQRLDRADLANRARGPRAPANRCSRELEDRVLTLRVQLKERSDLGEFGADAIHRALHAQGVDALPSVRTIGRILDRTWELMAAWQHAKIMHPALFIAGDCDSVIARSKAALDRMPQTVCRTSGSS